MKHQNKSLWQLLIVLIFCTISTAPAQTAPEIAEKALAATVYLEMQDSNELPLGFGSGFFVRQNLIATNYHVIEGAARGTAKLVGKNTTYEIEGVTATDRTNDLVLLKVTAYGIKPLPLGDSDDVKIGETVYVAGNPKGLEGTFSDGIISSRRDKYTKERLQMTAPISPGSSGGPVLNSKGEVIGVSFMTLVGGQNLNFAIPSRYLTGLLTKSKPAKPLAQGNRAISAETYFMWGNTKLDLGDYKGAITGYTHAIRLNPDDAAAYSNRGIAKSSLGQYLAAIVDYDIAIRLDPDVATAYSNRGAVKRKLGQSLAAIVDYDIAIRLNPDDATAYSNRGVAKSSLGQHLAAIADCDIAIRLNPDYATAYNNRGLAKDSLGQRLAAIADYDSAIRLKPDYAIAYSNRGIAKIFLGQYLAAIADYDIAIRLNPDDAETYYNRGSAKFLLSRISEAKQDLRTALRLAKQAGDTSIITEIETLLLHMLE